MVTEILAGLAPELTVLVGTFVILYAAVNARDGKLPAMIGFVTTMVASVFALGTIVSLPGLGFLPKETVVLDLFQVSTFSQVLKLLFLVGTGLVILASPKYMERTSMQAEYYALMLVATIGMMVVASSRDFLTLFIGIEVASFASYILAGAFKREPTSNESSLKYFITGALTSAISLYGISLLYGAAGTITFDGMNAFFADQMALFEGVANPGLQVFISQPIVAIGFFMILSGVGFKFTMAPFHMWAPDVYTGAPDTVAAWLGGVGFKFAFVALAKILLWAMGPISGGWIPFVAILAILTMTWGNLVALRQTDLKRMLAYSSIAHAGYILIVIPVATAYALGGGIFHTLANVLMKGGAFLGVAALATAGLGSTFKDAKGLSKTSPFLAFAITVFLLSMAGLPPLGGFWSKFVIFSSAVQAGLAGSWLWWLAVAGVVNTAISLWYYIRWIRVMYSEEPTHPVKVSLPGGLGAAIAVSLVGTVLVGFLAAPVIDWSTIAAEALFDLVP